jgi:hypothetical protein
LPLRSSLVRSSVARSGSCPSLHTQHTPREPENLEPFVAMTYRPFGP